MAKKRGTGLLSQDRLARIDRRLMSKYGPVCQICFLEIDFSTPQNTPMAYTRDHIIGVADGGTNAVDNFQPAHKKCNELKGKLAELVRMYNGIK